VSQLVDMGFPENKAKRVLKKFRNNFNAAMDHLINAPPDQDINDSPTEDATTNTLASSTVNFSLFKLIF
jgi:uncharacterized UBP type Zn finger protein